MDLLKRELDKHVARKSEKRERFFFRLCRKKRPSRRAPRRCTAVGGDRLQTANANSSLGSSASTTISCLHTAESGDRLER
ncbi:hypothetical protein L596_019848 [Steinernema carpocapsae]|uniref:Uncharacterized protein n=1 Tax=Steinernema carpocapsae TaxID=34508 RepID=A0A4U5MRV9_STECR|nr:hypothetical protein L596_019848 [Steinernema carpocapsae]